MEIAALIEGLQIISQHSADQRVSLADDGLNGVMYAGGKARDGRYTDENKQRLSELGWAVPYGDGYVLEF